MPQVNKKESNYRKKAKGGQMPVKSRNSKTDITPETWPQNALKLPERLGQKQNQHFNGRFSIQLDELDAKETR